MPFHFSASWFNLLIVVSLQPQWNAALGCPSECVCTASIQAVACNGVTNDFNEYAASSLPAWTVRLDLLCQPQLSSSGRPLPLGRTLTSLSAGVFHRFAELRDISIRSCPIGALPGGLFGYLPALKSVTLDNLLITSLPPSLFQGSPNLAELLVLRCPEYRQQSRGLLSGSPLFRVLKLRAAGLNGIELANLLDSASSARLESLEIVMCSDPPLRLSPSTLANFNLTSLVLSSNGLQDFSFLPTVGAAEVTVSYDPVPSGRLSFENTSPNPRVTLLRLEHTGLNEIPLGLSRTFPNLTELNLASNAITELDPGRLEKLSRLVRLDLGKNQIQALSDWPRLKPLLSTILYRDRLAAQVYIGENPIHCNCELAWIYDSPILSSSLLRDLVCRSGQFSGQLLIRVAKYELRCSIPSRPEIRLYYWPAVLHLTGLNASGLANESVLTPGQHYNLSRRRNVTLTCSSSSDPAPELTWRFLSSAPNSSSGAEVQELVRSKLGRDRQLTVTSLALLVDWLPLKRLNVLECVASSRYFDNRPRTNVTLLVPVDEVEAGGTSPDRLVKAAAPFAAFPAFLSWALCGILANKYII